MTNTEVRWQKDMANLEQQLAPYALTHPTGFMYLSDDAPDRLVGLYQRLTQAGYANGFQVAA